MRHHIFGIIATGLLLGACAKSKGESSSSNSAKTDSAKPISVVGVLAIDSGIEGATIKVFTVDTVGVQLNEIGDSTVQSAAAGTFALSIPPTDLHPGTEQTLMLMGIINSGDGQTILWSFSPAPAVDIALNVHVLASVGYEVGVALSDLSAAGVAKAESLTRAAFGVTEALASLPSDHPKVAGLTKTATKIATAAKVKLQDVVKALAADVADGTLDALAGGEPVVVGDARIPLKDYLAELKAL